MGRITTLQNQVGELQKKLAVQNNTIKSTEARDRKIKASVTATLQEKEGAKTARELLFEIEKLL